MQMTRKYALGATIVLAAGLAYAADQTILGSTFTVKDPKGIADTTRRKITGKGKEKGSPNTISGNPVVNGGTLVISATGTNSTTQPFALPQGTSIVTGKPFWSGDAVKGFKYKDPKGENGPIKSAQIKKSASGTFGIKVVAAGKNGLITVVPPNPGTSGCVLLGLNGGDTYSVQFGPTSQITNKGATLFKAKKPTAQGSCIAPTTSTTSTVTTSSSTSSSTSTTLYGSPSKAFFEHIQSLLD